MPAKSTYPSVEIPDVDLWTFLFENKQRPFPDDKVIYQDADTRRSYTYAQVKSTALEFGKGLKATWDWKKGDVLGIFSPNNIDIPAVIWGAHWAGGVLTPANPTYTADELAHQLKVTKAKALVTQLPMLPVAIAAAKLAGIPDDRVILLGDGRDKQAKYKHFTSVQNISRASRYRKTRVDPARDLAFMVSSSGTTGLPKMVMLSHRNIVANIIQFTAGEEGRLSWNGGKDGQGDKILAFLPFFHIYGLTCVVHKAIYSGIQLVVMSKFDIEQWCAHVQNFKITFSYIVPPVVVLLAKHPVVDKYNLSSLRMLSSGAAPLTRELVEAMHTRIKIGVKQGYGLSETSPTTHAQTWGDWDKFIGSAGRLLPNQEIKYMTTPDDESEPVELPLGQTGEIYVRGPNIFVGYLDNPAATAAAMSADGWFRTGDVGHEDSYGNLYITDRVKELIKYKGFQVAPAELEGLLVENDAIDDVAVIGVESEEHGSEVPRAYVVLNDRMIPSPTQVAEQAEKIVQWLAGKVAPHKRLRGGVRFVEEIPKSASGKILRRVLKEQAKKEEVVKAKL